MRWNRAAILAAGGILLTVGMQKTIYAQQSGDRIGGDVQPMQPLRMVPPVYPDKARSSRIQGTVVLDAVIAEDGGVRELQYKSGPPELTQAAMDAVKLWKYRPALLNGQPIEINITIRVVFTLDKTPQDALAESKPDASGPEQVTGSPPSQIHVTGIEAGMHLVRIVRPAYPTIAQVAHIQGTVVFHVVVSKSGSVEKLQYIAGHPLLMRAAADAVKQWQYRPFLANGQAVEATTTVQVVFGFGGNEANDALAQKSELAKRLQALLPGTDDVIEAALGYSNIHDFEAALFAARDLEITFAQLKCTELGGTFCRPQTAAQGMGLSKAIHALKPEMSKDDVKAAEKKAKDEAKALS